MYYTVNGGEGGVGFFGFYLGTAGLLHSEYRAIKRQTKVLDLLKKKLRIGGGLRKKTYY
jgi:hypothetical protein